MNFGRGAFFCQVKRSITAHLLPPLVTHEKKMRIEAADNTIITLVSEVADETVREESCLKATSRSPHDHRPRPRGHQNFSNGALSRYDMPKVDKVRAMYDRESTLGTGKYKVVLLDVTSTRTAQLCRAHGHQAPQRLPHHPRLGTGSEGGEPLQGCNRHLETVGCA